MSFFGWGSDDHKKKNPKRSYLDSKGFDPRRCPKCEEFPPDKDVEHTLTGTKAYCRDCDIKWVY